MTLDGRLLSLSPWRSAAATRCNIHIEKALYSCPGVYPATVQAFAQDILPWTACAGSTARTTPRDRGLRTSKLQYLPRRTSVAKLRFDVARNELVNTT